MQTLKELRLARGYPSIEHLIVAIRDLGTGCTANGITVDRWEKGKNRPTGNCMLALMQLFSLSPTDMNAVLEETKRRGDNK